MLKLLNLKVSLQDDRPLAEIAANRLGIPADALRQVKIVHKAVDARRKDKITLVYSLLLAAENEKSLRHRAGKDLLPWQPRPQQEIVYGEHAPPGRIIVVGAGPA